MPTERQIERELARAHHLRRKDEAKAQAAVGEKQKRLAAEYRRAALADPPPIAVLVNGRSISVPQRLAQSIDAEAYAGVDWDCGPDAATMIHGVLSILERAGIVFVIPLETD